MKQIALIGPTASGKTSLSINIAKELDAYVLSLDSLSIYKEIDISSAKPSVDEREGIRHFGIDILSPDECFDVTIYIELYKQAYKQASTNNKNLIIVGGTSFYLKILLTGISILPTISDKTYKQTKQYLNNLQDTYNMLSKLDSVYMSKISSNDSYRIEKALHIYLETGTIPSEYFAINPPAPIIKNKLSIYQIEINRDILRERISQRTDIMIANGLIDEVALLEYKYSRYPNCMKAIGIKETLDYLDGVYTKNELAEKITTNTARLAKRQTTFNNSQFADRFVGSTNEILKQIIL